MNFWDSLQLMAILEIRDYFREKDAHKQRIEHFYQECSAEIANASADLVELITDTLVKANPNVLPREAIEGCKYIPLYAMYRVLRRQPERITKEQEYFIERMMPILKLDFTKNEFLQSIRSQNNVSKRILNYTELTMNNIGSVWRIFLKAVHVEGRNEEAISEATKKYCRIVMRFSLLGRNDSGLTVARPICNEFIEALCYQSAEWENLSEEEFDYIGEVSVFEHKSRMENIALSLMFGAGAQNEANITDLLPYFFAGLIYQLVDRAKCNMREKGECVDFALKISNIDIILDGLGVVNTIKNGGELSPTFETVNSSFMGLLFLFSQQCDRTDDIFTFCKECLSYLLGVEKELSKKYPEYEFGKIATPLVSEKIDELMQMCE